MTWNLKLNYQNDVKSLTWLNSIFRSSLIWCTLQTHDYVLKFTKYTLVLNLICFSYRGDREWNGGFVTNIVFLDLKAKNCTWLVCPFVSKKRQNNHNRSNPKLMFINTSLQKFRFLLNLANSRKKFINSANFFVIVL